MQQAYTQQSPNITYKLNLHRQDPYHDLNLKLIKTFEPLINLKIKYWDDDSYWYRGISRIADLNESNSDWVLYVDPDMVFSTGFFDTLQSSNLDCTKVNGTGRLSTNIANAYKAIDAEQYTDSPVPDAVDKTSKIGPMGRRRMIGVGCFQLINRPYVLGRGLQYCQTRRNKTRTRDSALNQPNLRTSSDRYLRRIISTNKLVVPTVYHLNHWRSKDALNDVTACY